MRPEYFPVAYAVAEQQGKAPLGFDIASDPTRGPFLLRARDSGRPTATRVTPLLVGGAGINVYRPVYRDGAPIRTVAERRAALIGFAAGAFRVNDLAEAAITALPDSADIQIRADGDTVIGPDGELEDPDRAPIEIADRTWLLVVSDHDRPDIALPLLMAVVGVSLAALLGALILVWSRNERMRELQLQASQDPLTGLKNRRRFEEDLRTELARSRRDGTQGAVLMLDLDNFKQVNDTLGHPVGDLVIEEIADVLRAADARDRRARPGRRRRVRRSSSPAATRRRRASSARRSRTRSASTSPIPRAFPRSPPASAWPSSAPGSTPASSRCWPKPTRRCTGPRTAAATACGSPTSRASWWRSRRTRPAETFEVGPAQ